MGNLSVIWAWSAVFRGIIGCQFSVEGNERQVDEVLVEYQSTTHARTMVGF